MINVRKLFGFFVALLLAAFALPANASSDDDNKTYTLVMAVTAPGTSPAQVTAKFTNKVNSSFNSLTLSLPSFPAGSGYTITAVSSTRGTASPIAGGIKVSNINLPTGVGQSVTVTMTIATTGNTCTPLTGSWTAQPWTGSSPGSGSKFKLVAPSVVTTTINAVCNYSLDVTPPSPGIPMGPSLGSVTAKFTNLGTVPIQSLKLAAPTGFVIESLTGAPAGTTNDGSLVSIPNYSLSPGDTLSLNLTVSTNCATSSPGTWTSNAYSGVTYGLPAFVGTPSTGQTSVQGAGSCQLQFTKQPNDALKDAVITTTKFNNPVGDPVQVQLWVSGSLATWFTGNVTLTPGYAVNAVGGVANFPTLMLSTAGANIKLTASSTAGGVASSDSSPFKILDSIGNLTCLPPGGDPAIPGSYAFGDAAAGGYRGAFNKNADPCVPVVYNFTNNIVGNNTASLKWDTVAQPYAAASWHVLFQPEAVVPGTGLPDPARRTKVGFQPDGLGGYIYQYGVACVSSNLPAPYGTLAGDIDDTTTSIPVTTTATLPTPPFPITIGTERMTVNSVGASWGVTRGEGGTTAASHSSGASVMSTPLPIDPNQFLPDGSTANTYWNKQVPMCIWDEGWSSVGVGKVQFQTSVFDIGDGGVGRGF